GCFRQSSHGRVLSHDSNRAPATRTSYPRLATGDCDLGPLLIAFRGGLMPTLRRFWLRLLATIGSGHWDRDFGAELESILQMHVDDNLRRGMTPEEARRQAHIRLGGAEQVQQVARDRRGLPWLEVFGRDLRYAARTLLRTPGFAAVAMLVMAIGIGASVSLFTVIHSVLLRPLPFPHSDRLVAIYSQDAVWSHNTVAP